MFLQKENRIYILPTKEGWLFIALTLLTLVVSILYGNNLCYLLFFISFAFFVIALIQTHFNLVGTEIITVSVRHSFSGTTTTLSAGLRNKSHKIKYNHQLRYNNHISSPFFINPHQDIVVAFEIPTGKRGKHVLKSITLSTTYPFDFFKAWSTKKVNCEYYAYPSLSGELPLSVNHQIPLDANDFQEGKKGDDFSGHKTYEKGDTSHHIDWKALARGAGLLSKVFHDGGTEKYLLSWNKLPPSMDHEKKLSQMAQWIWQAEKKTVTFDLVLPHQNYLYKNKNHITECLIALAKFDEPPKN